MQKKNLSKIKLLMQKRKVINKKGPFKKRKGDSLIY
jgi:hypothetical protein